MVVFNIFRFFLRNKEILQEKSTSSKPASDICPVGKYCDGKTEKDCPKGTYNPIEGGTDLTSCKACILGKCCPTASTETPENCPVNHYCPEGTSDCKALPCPGNTI